MLLVLALILQERPGDGSQLDMVTSGVWEVLLLCSWTFTQLNTALWLVDSWSRIPDQIQMYPDRDTIAQLLPVHRLRLFVFAVWLFKEKSKYVTKHLMYGPSGKLVSFVFPRVLMFPSTSSPETSGLSGKQN